MSKYASRCTPPSPPVPRTQLGISSLLWHVAQQVHFSTRDVATTIPTCHLSPHHRDPQCLPRTQLWARTCSPLLMVLHHRPGSSSCPVPSALLLPPFRNRTLDAGPSPPPTDQGPPLAQLYVLLQPPFLPLRRPHPCKTSSHSAPQAKPRRLSTAWGSPMSETPGMERFHPNSKSPVFEQHVQPDAGSYRTRLSGSAASLRTYRPAGPRSSPRLPSALTATVTRLLGARRHGPAPALATSEPRSPACPGALEPHSLPCFMNYLI